MRRSLLIALTVIFIFMSFTACSLEELFGPNLKINVPDELIQADIGTYLLPEFQVVNKMNEVQKGYKASVDRVLDPEGNTVRVSYNRINVSVPGVYTVVYGANSGEIADAELKIKFTSGEGIGLHMKDGAIPKYYIRGLKYKLPLYTISGSVDYGACYIKLYYMSDFGEEKTEVDIVDSAFEVGYKTGFYMIRIHLEDIEGNSKNYEFIVEAVDSSMVNPGISHLPEYNGFESMIDCGKDTYMMLLKQAKINSFEEYCNLLEASKFEHISSRSVADNMFATFTFENKYVYVYYTKYNSEMRVMTGPIESLVLEDYSIDSAKTVTPYIASIPQSAQGEGYAFRLPDGRFIIQDGGYEGEDRVYNTLRSLVGDEPIVIAAWFISHPHDDHYPALIDFIKAHGKDSDVVIERIIYNFASTEFYPEASSDILRLSTNIATYAPNVPVLRAHTGQLIDFGSATVEILYTIEDHIPKTLSNVNDSSMVIRIQTEDNSIILLNDTCYESGPMLHNLWGTHLKSDIVQIAHHGMWPSVAEIYHDIQAKVVLFPNLHRYLKNYLKDSRWSNVIDVALSYARDISVSGDEIVVINLPYEFEDNKDAKINYILNYK